MTIREKKKEMWKKERNVNKINVKKEETWIKLIVIKGKEPNLIPGMISKESRKVNSY